jgi:hypothetical protein
MSTNYHDPLIQEIDMIDGYLGVCIAEAYYKRMLLQAEKEDSSSDNVDTERIKSIIEFCELKKSRIPYEWS